MDDLKEHLAEMNDLIGVEMNEMIPLEGELLSQVKQRLAMNWEPEKMYYTKTNLILTDINDYQRVKDLESGWEDTLRLEMPEFNMYIFVGRFINTSLKEILG